MHQQDQQVLTAGIVISLIILVIVFLLGFVIGALVL